MSYEKNQIILEFNTCSDGGGVRAFPVNGPNKVVMSLFVENDAQHHANVLFGQRASRVCDAEVYDRQDLQIHENSSSSDIVSNLVNALRDHVNEHGTISELCLSGDGGSMALTNLSQSNVFGVKDFLEALAQLEDEMSMKVVDRVVFYGDGVFSDLDSQDVFALRMHASRYDTELVGAMSDIDFNGAGYYACFDKDGAVNYDAKLHTRFSVSALLETVIDGSSGTDWLDQAKERNTNWSVSKDERFVKPYSDAKVIVY